MIYNIAAVIVTFNRCEYLKKVLSQLNQQLLPKDVKLNVIVIIDGSSDNTEEMIIQNFPHTTIINSYSAWWWTKSMNEGFKKSVQLQNDFSLILNDDIELKEDYIQTLWEDYKTLPQNSILGSASISINEPVKIESSGTKEFIKWRYKFKSYHSGFSDINADFKGIHSSWTLSGRGTLIPNQIFKEIGYYDEKLIQYGSDDEFCIRAKLKGIGVFISWNAHILNHTLMTSTGSPFKKQGISKLFKSYFNVYSVNSIRKSIYLYSKYAYPILLPVYLGILLLGDIKSYYFNYKN